MDDPKKICPLLVLSGFYSESPEFPKELYYPSALFHNKEFAIELMLDFFENEETARSEVTRFDKIFISPFDSSILFAVGESEVIDIPREKIRCLHSEEGVIEYGAFLSASRPYSKHNSGLVEFNRTNELIRLATAEGVVDIIR